VSDNNSPNQNDKALVIPAFGKSPALSLEMGSIREAESRYLEAKTVNPSSYVDLEHTFNESYRDLKRHVSSIGYQLTLAQKALSEAKADVILGAYAEYLENKPKSMDSTARMEAFLSKDSAYSAALDRVAQLKALESLFDGKIKVVENVCRYMRKKMDLIIRSGLTDSGMYTQGKRS
jgi:hypothetical protein